MLTQFPAVVLLGPRQAGKTTLAWQWARRDPSALYLDLELPSAQRQLEDAEAFLMAQRGRLVVLDEVQRVPELFAVLRGVIDARHRLGEGAGQFLLLGSASGVLLRQSSESLAGRVAQVELGPLQLRELLDDSQEGQAGTSATTVRFDQAHRLWLRGGFPLSWLAPTDEASLGWREAFITTYLERDIPVLGPRLPANSLRRLWTMLAHQQGALLNQSQLAASLGVSGQTVGRYIDVLCDLMLVRRLSAWHGNARKRLVRAPKVYVRDSGLVHALLGIPNREALLAHQAQSAALQKQLEAVAQERPLSELKGMIPPPRRGVSLAKAFVGPAARRCGEEGIQLHGAIGMTDEVVIGHLAKRLVGFANLLGDEAWHLERLAPA
jgi:predicted AAA+ superfamily ATPase